MKITNLRLLSIAILTTALGSFSQVEPCSTYTCDSLAVRAILDSNGFNAVAVNEVTSTNSSGRITVFHAESMAITSLPSEIGQMTALTQLYLERNQLSSIPPEIGQLTSLYHLRLAENQLTGLPSEIAQLTALTGLWLYGNQLTSLPPEIGQLTSLFELRINSNRLTSLPTATGQMNALRFLIVSGNKLTSLPPSIGQLANLRVLSLDSNQLTSLPPEIINLSRPIFTSLDVDFNLLCSVPDSIKEWIDQYSDSRGWGRTQMLDDTTYCDGTGTETPTIQVQSKQLIIQRNPVGNSLTITFPGSRATKSLSIYTLKGTLVKQFSTTESTITWKVRESGVYYIRAVVGVASRLDASRRREVTIVRKVVI